MARHKDTQWSVGEKITESETAILCVLMDIRDEMKETNRHLSNLRCSDAYFTIKRIDKRLQKRIKLK